MSAAMSTASSILSLPEGLHRDVAPSVYHTKHVGLVRSSTLNLIARSPAHYRAWLDADEERKTPALIFGSAFHCALLEPERFERDFAVRSGRRATGDDASISHDERDAIAGMVAAVRRHPLAGPMLEGGDAELTVRWRDQETGLECAARADYHRADLALGIDVKSSSDASAEAFRRSVATFGYHRQNAHYDAGFAAVGAPLAHFLFLVVEKTPPYAIGVYALEQAALGRAYQSNRALMRTLVDCLTTNAWPSYAETIQTIDLPPWAA